MKTFLKQYLIMWIKFLVLTPGIIGSTLFKTFCSLYLLFAATLLGDAKGYKEISDDMLYDSRL